jgi:hypothetical protein
VALCLRGLGAISEAKGRLAEALASREQSLSLVASSLEPSHPELRLAVDLVAGTHMLSRDWHLAEGLYRAVGDEMSLSLVEARRDQVHLHLKRKGVVLNHKQPSDLPAPFACPFKGRRDWSAGRDGGAGAGAKRHGLRGRPQPQGRGDTTSPTLTSAFFLLCNRVSLYVHACQPPPVASLPWYYKYYYYY